MSDEDRIRMAIEAMLPVQREIIAKAALAGVTFTPHEVWVSFKDGARGKQKTTNYYADLADGTHVGSFNDVYEAACVAMSIIEHEPKPDDGSFALLPGNEQPDPLEGPTRAGIDFAALAKLRRKGGY